MKEKTQNTTYIKIRIHKHSNKNTYLHTPWCRVLLENKTEAYKHTYNDKRWNPKEYVRM